MMFEYGAVDRMPLSSWQAPRQGAFGCVDYRAVASVGAEPELIIVGERHCAAPSTVCGT
jgi:hypothetical protein